MRLFAALLLFLSASMLSAQEAAQATTEQLLERVAQRPDRAWDYAFSLRTMTKGPDAGKVTPLLEKGLDHESEYVQLVCARLLLATGATEVALEALAGLLRSEDDRIIEAVATLVADEAPDHEDLTEKLRSCWEDSGSRDARARVALCEALWVLTGEQLPLDQLRESLGSGNHDLVALSAIALSRMGQAAAVEARLASIAREPGEIGRLARLGSEIVGIERAVEDQRSGKSAAGPEKLAVAQIRTLRAHYADDFFYYGDKRQKLDNVDLVDAACRAMSVGYDQYGAYMTTAEIEEMNQDMSMQYPGIGAHVAQGEDGTILITQPNYEGPAYKAGLRTGDKLVGVDGPDGQRIDLTKLTLDEGVKHVRGPEGTKVKVYIKRRNVEGELTFEVRRQSVRVDTAFEEMLPGRIGYVRLTRFAAVSDRDMKESLDNLRRMGMQHLILDLRGNGGGQMDAVLKICDQFLPEGKLICVTGGRYEPWKGMQAPNKSRGGEYNDISMVVLIDGESASGSEMLSGAIQDHERALVLGRQSFGKGVGQSFYPVYESNNTRVLKTTSFRYFLPGGSCPDRQAQGGIVPDIRIDPQYLQSWQVYALDKLRKSGRIDEYLDTHYRGEAKAGLMKLAAFDGLKTELWPEFEAFYASLNTRLDRDDIRREVRYALRARVQDDRGAEFTQNYQEDPVILRGVQELLQRAKIDVQSIPEYKAVMK